MILERGAILNSRYRIVEILGQGGMGSVYRAVDENLGMEVAVKDNLFTTEEYARQFRREAVILANLRHPNMPRVTDHFVIEGQGQYLVMDYIDGEDLRQRMDRIGLISEEEAIIIGAAICDALTYLSTRIPSIVHRDIKPGNVKITPQGQIFLVDFGLAKVIQGSQATTTGARAMTPGYSPPEQYGTARTDQRSDIFSLGATLYAALTGAIPEDALARAMEQTELTSIRKYNPRVSRRLANVIEKALEIRPDDRYQTAEEFKQALLSVRGTTRRNTGEYKVPPPPEIEEKPISPDGIVTPAVPSDPPQRRADNISPMPLLVSTPLEEPISHPRYIPRRRRNPARGCLIITLIILVVLGGGIGIAYLYDTNLPSQVLALIWPPAISRPAFLFPPPATVTPTPTTAETASLTTPTADPIVVIPPTATPTLPLPTPTPQPTATEVPSTQTPLPTPAGGGSGEIAYASEIAGIPQLFLLNVDTGENRQITDLMEGACQPDWSPDGLRLVFISPCDSNHESYPLSALFVINWDGSGLTPLPSVPGGDYDPAWSPDGKSIVFTSVRTSGRPRIYMLSLEDNSVRRLSDLYSRDMQPAWSPDGRKIVFISTRKGPAQVWTMNPDGSNQEMFSRSSDLINAYPTFSPDGQLILFTQIAKAGEFPHLVVAPLDENGLNEYLLNSGPIPMREGRYSPDGYWIAFESWPKGFNHDIYLMTANGAGRRQLTTDGRNDFDPVWRPVISTPAP